MTQQFISSTADANKAGAYILDRQRTLANFAVVPGKSSADVLQREGMDPRWSYGALALLCVGTLYAWPVLSTMRSRTETAVPLPTARPASPVRPISPTDPRPVTELPSHARPA